MKHTKKHMQHAHADMHSMLEGEFGESFIRNIAKELGLTGRVNYDISYEVPFKVTKQGQKGKTYVDAIILLYGYHVQPVTVAIEMKKLRHDLIFDSKIELQMDKSDYYFILTKGRKLVPDAIWRANVCDTRIGVACLEAGGQIIQMAKRQPDGHYKALIEHIRRNEDYHNSILVNGKSSRTFHSWPPKKAKINPLETMTIDEFIDYVERKYVSNKQSIGHGFKYEKFLEHVAFLKRQYADIQSSEVERIIATKKCSRNR